jgi:hypothetical protein
MRTLSFVQATGVPFGLLIAITFYSKFNLYTTFLVWKDLEYLSVPAALFVPVGI